MGATVIDQQDIQRVRVRLSEVVQESLKMGRVQRGQAQEIRISRAGRNRPVQVKVLVGVLIAPDRLRAAPGNAATADGLEPEPTFIHRPHFDRLPRPGRNDGLDLRAEGGAEGRNGLSVFFDATGAAP